MKQNCHEKYAFLSVIFNIYDSSGRNLRFNNDALSYAHSILKMSLNY